MCVMFMGEFHLQAGELFAVHQRPEELECLAIDMNIVVLILLLLRTTASFLNICKNHLVSALGSSGSSVSLIKYLISLNSIGFQHALKAKWHRRF